MLCDTVYSGGEIPRREVFYSISFGGRWVVCGAANAAYIVEVAVHLLILRFLQMRGGRVAP